MARQWEKFSAGPTRSTRDQMHVTLNKKGTIMLNRKAFQDLGSPKAVVLFFEKTTSVIGVSPAHDKLREAFPVKCRNDQYWVINAISFCRHFGIDVTGTKAFTDPEIDDKGVLELDLRATRVIFADFGAKTNLRREAELAT